jgi:ribosomal protein L37AE/L43A
MAYPKCQHCGHSRTKHIRSFSDVFVCNDCSSYIQFGPTYEWEFDADPQKVSNYVHAYHPDNLSYIEKLAERKGLV